MNIRFDKRVNTVVSGLSETERGRILKYLDLFNTYGFGLPSKYLKKLDKNLWELRPGYIRLLFGKTGKTGKTEILMIVHCFKKKTQKTPKKELETAKSRIKEYTV